MVVTLHYNVSDICVIYYFLFCCAFYKIIMNADGVIWNTPIISKRDLLKLNQERIDAEKAAADKKRKQQITNTIEQLRHGVYNAAFVGACKHVDKEHFCRLSDESKEEIVKIIQSIYVDCTIQHTHKELEICWQEDIAIPSDTDSTA